VQRLAQVLEDGKGTMVDVFNDVEESGYEDDNDKRRNIDKTTTTSREHQRGIDKRGKKHGKKRGREVDEGQHGSREEDDERGKKRRSQQEDEGTSTIAKVKLDRLKLKVKMSRARDKNNNKTQLKISRELVEGSDSILNGPGEYETFQGSAE
jgi:hypothetical protein